MKRLFEKTTIKGMTLTNRFVRSATWEGMCEKDGKQLPGKMGIHTDEAQEGKSRRKKKD